MAWVCKKCGSEKFYQRISETQLITGININEHGVVQGGKKELEYQEELHCVKCGNYTIEDDIEKIADWKN